MGKSLGTCFNAFIIHLNCMFIIFQDCHFYPFSITHNHAGRQPAIHFVCTDYLASEHWATCSCLLITHCTQIWKSVRLSEFVERVTHIEGLFVREVVALSNAILVKWLNYPIHSISSPHCGCLFPPYLHFHPIQSSLLSKMAPKCNASRIN